MKKPTKSDLFQRAKQELLRRIQSPAVSSDRLSQNGASTDPVEFALSAIRRCAETKAARMVISGKSRRLLPEISQLDGHLRELEISHTEITDLSPLGGLPSLESLKINASEIADFSVLASLKKLQRLELSHSGEIHVKVPDLPELIEIKILNTHGNITLGNLPKLEKAEFQVLADLAEVTKQPELVELKFQKVGNLSLDALTRSKSLRQIDARLHGAMDLHPLASHTGLKKLKLTAPEVTDISPISELSGLEALELNDFKVSDARPLKNLTQMRSLALRFKVALADLSFLSDMKELTHLVFCPSANSDLRPLTELPHLQDAALVQISARTDLSPLSFCRELRRLVISTDKNAYGPLLRPLPSPPSLEILSLFGGAFENLDGLENCSRLITLTCSSTNIVSLHPLIGMENLTRLDVAGSRVSDLSVLATLPCFVGENSDIGLALRNTPAVERYPELAQLVSRETGRDGLQAQHDTAIKAVRILARETRH